MASVYVYGPLPGPLKGRWVRRPMSSPWMTAG